MNQCEINCFVKYAEDSPRLHACEADCNKVCDNVSPQCLHVSRKSSSSSATAIDRTGEKASPCCKPQLYNQVIGCHDMCVEHAIDGVETFEDCWPKCCAICPNCPCWKSLPSSATAINRTDTVSKNAVSRDTGCCFHLTANGGPGGVVGQLDDGQNRIGQDPPGLPIGEYCINGQGGSWSMPIPSST